jgi:precorrin-2 dehydrogenase/sirohydrochlorin ferrochelatase
MLDGETLSAVVVGGGRVGTRKALALLDAGAAVRVIAPSISSELEAREDGRLTLVRRRVDAGDVADALLVIAATDDAEVNARVAAEARALGRLVNVATAPELGNCATPAVHRAGGIAIAVTAERVPRAAGRIRDRIAGIVDERYAAAVRELSALRAALLEGARRDRWVEVNDALVDDDFCAAVEARTFDEKVAAWR